MVQMPLAAEVQEMTKLILKMGRGAGDYELNKFQIIGPNKRKFNK
jgi:hypothetical protein